MSSTNTAKPKLACEIAADRVLAGRVMDNGGGLEASAARELAPGSVVPDLVETNLRQRTRCETASKRRWAALPAFEGCDRDRARRRRARHARGF